MKKYLDYIHPFLFSIYPVLFLYSQNIKEYTESSILIPLLFSLLFGSMVFLITKFLLKDIGRTAIVSSFIIFTTLSFGRLINLPGLITLKLGGVSINKQFILTAILLIFLCLIIRAVNKFPASLPKVNQLFLVLATLLIVFAIIPIITFEIKTGRVISGENKKQDNIVATSAYNSQANYPDIYYFIFDRYAGPKSMAAKFKTDNSQFYNFLKEKGFYLATDSSTNYPKTFLSLTSSLNMKYLDFLTQETGGGESSDESIATPYLRNNDVINYLDDKGYFLVNVGPKTWNPTSKNPNSDKNYVLTKGTYPFVDAFGTGFLNMTIAEPIFKEIFKNPFSKYDISQDPHNNEHRQDALYELSVMDEVIKLKGPKFVFVHILLPHDPFVFDENCNPINEKQVKKHDHVYNYTKQLKCTNSHIEKIVNNIFAYSPQPPIIILQSDEGPFPMLNPIPPKQGWGTANSESLKEKFPILNAYYFPNKKYNLLYPSITPVNSFRVVFNTFFGEKHKLLEDKNYVFYDDDNYYKFTDVTDRLK